MVAVSYFAVKAMMLLIDCKYKVLSVIYQYENLTDEFSNADKNDIKINIPRDKVKCVDGRSYVELKADHDSDDESNNNSKRRSHQTTHSINYSDIGFAAFGFTGSRMNICLICIWREKCKLLSMFLALGVRCDWHPLRCVVGHGESAVRKTL